MPKGACIYVIPILEAVLNVRPPMFRRFLVGGFEGGIRDQAIVECPSWPLCGVGQGHDRCGGRVKAVDARDTLRRVAGVVRVSPDETPKR